jgi:hypothetical protein
MNMFKEEKSESIEVTAEWVARKQQSSAKKHLILRLLFRQKRSFKVTICS